MSNYQAIPKAKDLLDYTMQRTTAKDGGDGSKPRFPKSQAFGYCKALRDSALKLLELAQAANDYYFETQFDERLIALDGVMQKCELMLHLIDLSLKRGYITADQCHYWTELVTAVKRPVFVWRKNDGNRAAALREAKQAAEVARIAEIVRRLSPG
jgi:hypothetical protein